MWPPARQATQDKVKTKLNERSCYFSGYPLAVRKGELTRNTILDRAVRLASEVGLSGLTIGRLARDLELSKSGLFAHFQSKETLQLQVLGRASHIFIQTVVRPALAQPRGEPRVQALFDRWLDWTRTADLPGGETTLTVRIDPWKAPQRGGRVSLRPRAGHAHLFDPETGDRLG